MSLHFRRQERRQLPAASSQVRLLQAGTPSRPGCSERPEAACPGLGPALLNDWGSLPDFSGLGFLAFISTQSRASSPLSASSLPGRPRPLWAREGLGEKPLCETTQQGGAPAGNGHLGQGSLLTVRSPGSWLGLQRGCSPPPSGRGSSPGGEAGTEAILAGQGHPHPHGAQTPPAPWTVWEGRVLARKVTPTLRSAVPRGCGRGECPPEHSQRQDPRELSRVLGGASCPKRGGPWGCHWESE